MDVQFIYKKHTVIVFLTLNIILAVLRQLKLSASCRWLNMTTATSRCTICYTLFCMARQASLTLSICRRVCQTIYWMLRASFSLKLVVSHLPNVDSPISLTSCKVSFDEHNNFLPSILAVYISDMLWYSHSFIFNFYCAWLLSNWIKNNSDLSFLFICFSCSSSFAILIDLYDNCAISFESV